MLKWVPQGCVGQAGRQPGSWGAGLLQAFLSPPNIAPFCGKQQH